jgi:glycosyltransferase involved in cell wall biosynthesis
MKVLLVTHYYGAHGGGVEIVAGEIARELLKGEHVEIAWASSDVDELPAEAKGLRRFPMRTWNIIEKKTGMPYPLWSLPSILRLAQAVRAADVVHLHDYIYSGNLAAYVFAKIMRKPVVITQHIGLVPYKNRSISFALDLVNRTLGRFLLGRAQAAVFISREVMRYFKMEDKPGVFFVPNGVDGAFFTPAGPGEKGKLRAELCLDAQGPVFLFVGRFVEKKGLHVLKELAREFSRVTWVFAGWGPIAPESWELPNVKVFRKADKKKIADLYKASDLLVLPSVGEGFPLVVQEAMSSALPVAVNREVAMAYPGAENVMLSPGSGDTEAWKRMIQGVISDPPASGTMGESSLAFSRGEWDWEKCARDYSSIFGRLSSKRK